MKYPDHLRYTRDHEWALIQGKTATIGITDHAQSALGDVVFVDLPQVGRNLKDHETFGVVESIKAVSDLYAPLAGRVTEVNSSLVQDPSLVNRAPHTDAWMVKIELTDPAAIQTLMNAEAYQQYVESLR